MTLNAGDPEFVPWNNKGADQTVNQRSLISAFLSKLIRSDIFFWLVGFTMMKSLATREIYV